MNNYFAAAQPTSWGITALILSRLDFEADKSNRTTSLFTIARKKQFCSYYFSAAPGYLAQDKGYYKQMFDPDIQFFREEFFDKYNFGVENEWGLSDRTLYSGVFKELKECQAERFIAVISTIDTHPPYHHSELTPEEEKSFPNVFLQSLYSADRELNVFIQKIMQDPKLYNERTLIILTSDHTATHGENYTKRKIFSPERIPLIFITPNQKIFQKLDRNKYASSIDLAPTILSLIGCEIPSSFMGRSLFSEKNRAITSYGHFLIVHSPDEQNLYINMKAPEGILQTAYRDFYYSYYGK
jgi:phosphoglycerol transferase MdoB-like AlkP superfamily enzyme